MDGSNAKQQIVERIKGATNILVTVSTNPSVDELSAALGLTLMLNKMDKHGTAVFSGAIPPAIDFLEPGKTFENTVDSLRDFIIALDKEKADRLRYKVEDDVVRIFITPYRTTITEHDLKFSQGDFNVELVIALGVEEREELDRAIVAHGRILHDATIATINAKKDSNNLGSIDWQDEAASSLCEMLMSLSEALQPNLLDEQISNALLTGIVAATDRFRNEHTKPRVMTMAAQLMAAGANQQLIATKLEQASVLPSNQPKHPDGSTPLPEGESSSVKSTSQQAPNGEMVVDHNAAATTKQAEDNLSGQLPPAQPAGPPPDLDKQLQKEANQEPPLKPPSEQQGRPSWLEKRVDPPSMGGTFNATAAQALDDKLQEEEIERNHMVLSHDMAPSGIGGRTILPADDHPADRAYLGSSPPPPEQREPSSEPQPEPEPSPLPEYTAPEQAIGHTVEDMSYEEAPVPPHEQTLAELEAEAKAHAADVATQAAQAQPMPPPDSPTPRQPVPRTPAESDADVARHDINAAFGAQPFDPANQPAAGAGAQPFPPIEHDASAQAPLPGESPQIRQHDTPMLPPMPDFSTLPPLPGDPPAGQQGGQEPPQPGPGTPPPAPPAGGSPPPPPSQPGPSAPGQFQIPGQ
jgi:hypothetical protein